MRFIFRSHALVWALYFAFTLFHISPAARADFPIDLMPPMLDQNQIPSPEFLKNNALYPAIKQGYDALPYIYENLRIHRESVNEFAELLALINSDELKENIRGIGKINVTNIPDEEENPHLVIKVTPETRPDFAMIFAPNEVRGTAHFQKYLAKLHILADQDVLVISTTALQDGAELREDQYVQEINGVTMVPEANEVPRETTFFRWLREYLIAIYKKPTASDWFTGFVVGSLQAGITYDLAVAKFALNPDLAFDPAVATVLAFIFGGGLATYGKSYVLWKGLGKGVSSFFRQFTKNSGVSIAFSAALFGIKKILGQDRRSFAEIVFQMARNLVGNNIVKTQAQQQPRLIAMHEGGFAEREHWTILGHKLPWTYEPRVLLDQKRYMAIPFTLKMAEFANMTVPWLKLEVPVLDWEMGLGTIALFATIPILELTNYRFVLKKSQDMSLTPKARASYQREVQAIRTKWRARKEWAVGRDAWYARAEWTARMLENMIQFTGEAVSVTGEIFKELGSGLGSLPRELARAMDDTCQSLFGTAAPRHARKED